LLNEIGSLFGVLKYVCDIVVKKFTFAISSPDEFLLFVRSLRESNFALYVHALTELMPWFFILDRCNYARWLSVHVRDMRELPSTHPAVYAQFQMEKFTAKKTTNRFSALALDHVHEQLNAIVKGDGGIIGRADNRNVEKSLSPAV